MKKNIQVSISILSSDFNKLGCEIKKIEDSGADMVHVDVMDGMFVPNISIGQVIVEHVNKITDLPIDTHLMIEHPGRYVESFVDKGSDIVGVHVECYGKRRAHCLGFDQYPKEVDVVDLDLIRADIQKIQAKGKKVFLVKNPGTPNCFDDLLSDIDGVLFMTVNPGFSGQSFKSEVLPQIKDLRSKFDGDISIDGGINQETAPLAVKAGVNILATASYFFNSDDPRSVVDYLKSLS